MIPDDSSVPSYKAIKRALAGPFRKDRDARRSIKRKYETGNSLPGSSKKELGRLFFASAYLDRPVYLSYLAYLLIRCIFLYFVSHSLPGFPRIPAGPKRRTGSGGKTDAHLGAGVKAPHTK